MRAPRSEAPHHNMDTQSDTQSPTAASFNWSAWLKEHGSLLYHYARKLDAAEAEDIMQYALIQSARAVREGRLNADPQEVLRYACTVLRHEAYSLNAQRQVHREGVRLWAQSAPMLTAADAAAADRCSEVEQAVHRLDTPYAEVILLHLWGGQTFREIAAMTGETTDAVSSRYRYALILLKKLLQHP